MIQTEKALADISRTIGKLWAGRSDLNKSEEHYLFLLMRAKEEIKTNTDFPPLLMLELFLFSRCMSCTAPGFILDWLYEGALAFHQSEGQVHFEYGLGFSAGRGKYSGQGNEFKKARREQKLERDKLFTWIRMLNQFENIVVDRAVGIVHEIHSRQLSTALRKLNPISFSELHTEYRGWKGKKWDQDKEALYRKEWGKYREEWLSLIAMIESDS